MQCTSTTRCLSVVCVLSTMIFNAMHVNHEMSIRCLCVINNDIQCNARQPRDVYPLCVCVLSTMIFNAMHVNHEMSIRCVCVLSTMIFNAMHVNHEMSIHCLCVVKNDIQCNARQPRDVYPLSVCCQQ